ncbi:MAG: hypothetical protein JXJ20_13650, partial [Anaerolineae bacterium]|nr:hypothetical protein [Anaerolineae bacterium]
YWMHIEIPAAATLQDLDRFLRKIWLECCGHLSMFRIGEYNYVSYVEDVYDYPEDRDMRVPLGDVLEPGAAFTHEYDFGTTTYLTLKVIEDRTGVPSGDDLVYIMARNEQPEILCSACGNSPATEVCAACIWDGSGWLCDDCAPDHECGEDMLLPVVNSPRVGMCAYMGEIEDYEDFDDFF